MAEYVVVVEVPRAWVREHGWPWLWSDMLAAGFVPEQRERWELIGASYQDAGVAYLREGPEGQALLFVQAWPGPA